MELILTRTKIVGPYKTWEATDSTTSEDLYKAIEEAFGLESGNQDIFSNIKSAIILLIASEARRNDDNAV